MSVEEELYRLLVVLVTVIIAQFEDVIVRPAEAEPAEPRARNAVQSPPRHYVPFPSDVDHGVDGHGPSKQQQLRVDRERKPVGTLREGPLRSSGTGLLLAPRVFGQRRRRIITGVDVFPTDGIYSFRRVECRRHFMQFTLDSRSSSRVNHSAQMAEGRRSRTRGHPLLDVRTACVAFNLNITEVKETCLETSP